jgi:hypothetical protein
MPILLLPHPLLPLHLLLHPHKRRLNLPLLKSAYIIVLRRKILITTVSQSHFSPSIIQPRHTQHNPKQYQNHTYQQPLRLNPRKRPHEVLRRKHKFIVDNPLALLP